MFVDHTALPMACLLLLMESMVRPSACRYMRVSSEQSQKSDDRGRQHDTGESSPKLSGKESMLYRHIPLINYSGG